MRRRGAWRERNPSRCRRRLVKRKEIIERKRTLLRRQNKILKNAKRKAAASAKEAAMAEMVGFEEDWRQLSYHRKRVRQAKRVRAEEEEPQSLSSPPNPDSCRG
jgi:hypothetical protein